MEENSEVHMDTDVSSTTSDTPGVQQVTGIHCNVETIIVVEELKEEVLNSNVTVEPSQTELRNKDDALIVSESTAESDPSMILNVPPSQQDQVNNTRQKTPTKSDQMQKINSKPDLKTASESVSVQETLITSQEIQKTSAMSEEVPKSPKKIEDQKSPMKSDEVHKTPTKSRKILQKNSEMSLDNEMTENIVNITVGDLAVVRPLKVTVLVSEPNSLTKESSMTMESSKKGIPSRESPDTLDSVNKSGTSTVKESVQFPEKPNLYMASTENPVQNSVSSDNPKENSNSEKKEEKVMDICEKSNDSQTDLNSDISEKDHNKSISRELKSLIKSAKESKIISECTQLTSKTRKSRAAADNSNNTSLNISVDAEKIQGVRRSSINSQKSNCSEKSEKTPSKRSMRSQNPEFVNKVKQFLNSVTGKSHKGETDEDDMDASKKDTSTESTTTCPPKKKRLTESQPLEVAEQSNKLRSDFYCWRCHWAAEYTPSDKGHPPLQCSVCPRSFHYKCLSGSERSKTTNEKNWVCPECLLVLHAESSETRSPAMKKISLGLLCELLQYALGRMTDLNGVEPFMNPVDRTAFPDYDKYVVHPMDLSLMKKNISDGLYGSTEAFLADAQWILHNSIIFNTLQSKLTGGARALVRSCRTEMGEIEACPECYAAAHARRPTWFTDVCSTPHMLMWAKLKGFPYWPAKGMSVNSQGHVDVRFFGAHDRAWVPARDCFLYCEKDPNNFKAKRQDILESMQEAEEHIANIKKKYGKFVYASFKTQFDPTKLNEQLKMMIPAFDGEIKEKTVSASPNSVKDKSRSNSKSSKSSIHEGDISENEETQASLPRKMAGGAEIAREDEDSLIEKSKPMEIDEESVQIKGRKELKEVSRKRRRSFLEEAVITIITTSSSEKKKKVENEIKDQKSETSEENSGKTEETLNQTDKSKEKNKAVEMQVPTTSSVNAKEVSSNKIKTAQIVSSTPLKVTLGKFKLKPSKTSTPKEKDVKSVSPKHNKSTRSDKSAQIEKEKQDENHKTFKRRHSRHKSLNGSQSGKGEKTDKKSDKVTSNSISNTAKDKSKDKAINKAVVTEVQDKESNLANKTTENVADNSEKPNKSIGNSTTLNKSSSNSATESPKPSKDRIQFDDNTSLAVLARGSSKKNVSSLPTISSVRSLSTTANSNTDTTTNITTTTNAKTIEITVAANSDSSVFIQTSSENVRNMKEATDKLQQIRKDDKPTVGRLGVKAFARMTTPPAPLAQEKQKSNEVVEVEVKSEPVDFDDADRQVEKLDLMKAFQLQPVNPVTSTNLRDVRMNKVVVTPIARKAVVKTTEVRIGARKTFPSARKEGNDGRSELNGKNSMVYIPIQPPSTQAPVQRVTRPITINGSVNTQNVRPQVSAPLANNVNTLTTPLVSTPMTSMPSVTQKPASTNVTNSPCNTVCVPTVGQVPTAVHTVPLITSVNGQWTFSLQPVMSVGGEGTPPVVNGVTERTNPTFVNIAPNTPHLAQLHAAAKILPANNISNNNANTNSILISNNTNSGGDVSQGELPRLQQRPPLLNPLDPNVMSDALPVPATAGPLTAKLSRNAVKLADFFRNLLEDSLEKVDDPVAQMTVLKMQLEQAQWKHQQEINELKHTTEILTTEMRVSFEKEKTRALSEARRAAQQELEAAVKAAKAKQWCANCSQEAQFYCCWNTSYCDYLCQRAHWAQHSSVCTQQRSSENTTTENGNTLDKRLQSAPEPLPRTASGPAVSVGAKITPARVYSQEAHQQKTSIIVSMVDDATGTPTVKCVGTYKPAPTGAPVSPIIINNKQIINNDENSTKKVMASGGYLIVGASNSAPLTPGRRAHPVQITYNT